MRYFFQDIKHIFEYPWFWEIKQENYISLTFQIQDCTSILKSPLDEKQNTKCKGNRVASIRCRTPSVECDDNSGDHWHCGRYRWTILLSCKSVQFQYKISENYFVSSMCILMSISPFKSVSIKLISYCFSVKNVSI